MTETYLAWDPGETTGWAQFNHSTGRPFRMGFVKYGPELFSLLELLNPNFHVIEEFMLVDETIAKRNNIQHYARKWDKIYAARAIGAVENQAAFDKVPVYFQRSSILKTAAQAFALPLKGFKDMQHPIDAILHGAYYAWDKMGILPPERFDPPSEPEEPRSTVVQSLSSYADISKLTSAQSKRSK